MYWKTGLLAAAAVIALVAAPHSNLNPIGSAPAFARCDPGERIDGSTANDARRAMQRAGYANIRDLRKGCDNYWHAIATRDGATMRIVLAPSGEILREGD
jgi:hypothetical protein